jgi:lipopolysaccharide/colanic/teichoic acid biosynthesis glycosyltransferase
MTKLFGRIVAFVLCLGGLPIHLAICLALRLQDGGPAIYRCLRLGRGGQIYYMLKYRTMKVGCPPVIVSGFRMIVAQADPRVTRLGRWLRCGIDELPQLWNIVRGEMGWVGPRPDEAWMLPHHGPVCKRRLWVRPGITGLAQVLDSRNLSTAEGYAIDVWYITHRCIWLDAWIVLVTPPFMAGWRSVGQGRLTKLRKLPEIEELRQGCDTEIARSEASEGTEAAHMQRT